MRYRVLGQSGIEASVVAFGAWAVGGWFWGGCDDAESIAAIRRGLDVGMNFVDTAPIYGQGRSEEVVGKAIKGRRRRGRPGHQMRPGLVGRPEGQLLRHRRRQAGAPLPGRRVHPPRTRAEPAPSSDRLHRPLSDPLAGRHHAHRRDHGHAAGAQGGGQDPGHRREQRLARADGRVPRGGPARRRPGALQHARPADGRRHSSPTAIARTSPCWPTRRWRRACSPAR